MTTYEAGLKPYAASAANARARLYEEAESSGRSPFQRDRDRIIHCSTFRRLKHKTQVFVFHEGDYYRTRLTHSIEVAQIARSICRSMELNEDLAEALSLAHDFGHTAFGHAGEEALDAAMKPFGGFDHNAQSLRLVTTLEHRYAAFPGLNLTWDTLEGLAKHNGPLVDKPIKHKKPPKTLPYALREYLATHDLEVHTYPSAEAQISALSDDIAYNNHDIDDGLRANLFEFSHLKDVPLVGRAVAEVEKQHQFLALHVKIHEVVRRLINVMVTDIIKESTARIKALSPGHPDEIRNLGSPVIAFSDKMADDLATLKAFLNENMYRHYRVNRMSSKGKKVVTELFDLYTEEPGLLPPEWSEQIGRGNKKKTARVVADFIAGMTDRYALREHKKLFDITALEI